MRRVAAFVVVGGLAFLVDAGVLVALERGAGWSAFEARIASIGVAALVAWRLNRAVTFGASGSSQAAEGGRYAVAAAASAAVNYGVFSVVLLIAPAVASVAAAAVATLMAAAVSYGLMQRWVFRRP